MNKRLERFLFKHSPKTLQIYYMLYKKEEYYESMKRVDSYKTLEDKTENISKTRRSA
jgi:hypothetical protein